jgi:hypothetical protein
LFATAAGKPDWVLLGVSSLSFRKLEGWKEMFLDSPAAKTWHFHSFLLRTSWLYASRKALCQKILFDWDDKIPEKTWDPPGGVSALGYKALFPDPEQPGTKGIRQFFERGIASPEQVPAKPEQEYFDEKRFARLENLLDLFARKKISVAIIVTPGVLYPYPYNLRERQLFQKKLASLKERGAVILDFQNEPAFQNKESFVDVYHLSSAGSQAFSSFLAQKLHALIRPETASENGVR